MKLFELVPYLMDKVVLYKKGVSDEYDDIFKGLPRQIPMSLLEKNIGVIGSKKNGVLDIEIR